MSLYLVDSNFFIQAHRAYYPLDVVESFWHKIAELSRSGVTRSIDKVRKEIYDKSSHEDELKVWCQSKLPDDFFLSTGGVISDYVRIVQWIKTMNHHYTQIAIEEFLETDLADPWLVAFAMGEDITIVTYEKVSQIEKNALKYLKFVVNLVFDILTPSKCYVS